MPAPSRYRAALSRFTHPVGKYPGRRIASAPACRYPFISPRYVRFMDERATNRRFPMATRLPIGSADAQAATMSKAARLRGLLHAPALSFIMEAHNGLSAKIVEEAGFEGIWASGLSMSAALGVRDNNEASWTQVLEMLEFMADATTIPILVDGDTGYGNFNNVRRLVRKLCQRGIAGVCIEDKLFPKTNSFIGENQPLADVDEFCGRIKAGKDSQSDDDFQIVARVEALIAGWGMDEALRRAEAYHRAGADAVLIHSKKETADEITGFCRVLGRPGAGGDRAHHVSPHADADVPGCRGFHGDMGEPQHAGCGVRDAPGEQGDQGERIPRRRRGGDHARTGGLFAHGPGRARCGGGALSRRGRRSTRDPACRLARREARPAYRAAPEVHDRRARRAPAPASRPNAQRERPARRDGGARLPQGSDRSRRHRGGRQRSLRRDWRGRLPRLRLQSALWAAAWSPTAISCSAGMCWRGSSPPTATSLRWWTHDACPTPRAPPTARSTGCAAPGPSPAAISTTTA